MNDKKTLQEAREKDVFTKQDNAKDKKVNTHNSKPSKQGVDKTGKAI